MNPCFGHRVGQVVQLLGFGFEQVVGAVESRTTVVTDDATTGVVVGKSRQEAPRAKRANLVGLKTCNQLILMVDVSCFV